MTTKNNYSTAEAMSFSEAQAAVRKRLEEGQTLGRCDGVKFPTFDLGKLKIISIEGEITDDRDGEFFVEAIAKLIEEDDVEVIIKSGGVTLTEDWLEEDGLQGYSAGQLKKEVTGVIDGEIDKIFAFISRKIEKSNTA
jgi:hypothetical protein